ncbi:MAG: cupin [Gammaproteobacteria bacterium]|nr:cupin [Gammaproteobacteria bacterium]MDH4253148.1 cupin [Gammaproteobacteria bacterium]MDH5308490.1 cupin [Gammaproteobacteria bacterium]
MRSSALVLPCHSLDETLAFFTERLGFRLDEIYPADAPRIAVVSRGGLVVRLEEGRRAGPGLRLSPTTPAPLPGATPDGLPLEFVAGGERPLPPPLPAERFALHRGSAGDWGRGRAGMQYRDLIPGRIAGSYVASHIRIPQGGPVPDYVHHHHVHFQVIYCYRGWVRVAYEDQGPPITMQAGDCVLQPPHIRHRVLECSDGLEVVEIASPAEHVTLVEHELALPTGRMLPEREFGGQRFVFHQSAKACWHDWRLPGFAARDTGIAVASRGTASVVVARVAGPTREEFVAHAAGFVFDFLLAGSVTLDHGDESVVLQRADAVVLPPRQPYRYRAASPDLEILEVAMPAKIETSPATRAR